MKKQPIPTICPYCGCGCGMHIVVENGRAANIEYMSQHPVNEGTLCPKGNAALEMLYHPERLHYPMKKEKGNWARISWDEAFSLISGKLKEVRDSWGPNALGFLASAKCTNEENYLFQKLARTMGTNNVDHCARLCHAPSVTGLVATLGSGAMTNPIPDIANSKCIFIIGSNFAENHPIASRWIWDAKERGAKVIVADPRYTPTAWMADLYLQLNPGTDIAMINGIIHTIIAEKLFNRGFVERRTLGFEEIDNFAKKYTPEEVEEITDIPKAQIQEAARVYAKAEAASIVYCMGITQHTCGDGNVISCANLALLCGNAGRPGTGVLPLRGQDNVQGACDMGALAAFLPGYIRVSDEVSRKRMAALWGREDLSEEPGLTVVEMVNAAWEGKVKGMYIMAENPMVSDPNTEHVRKALEKLDFLAVQDIFLTETAQLADVVLPAACWAEKEGTVTATSRSVQWRPKVIDSPGETKADLEIICELAKRFGLDFEYKSSDEVLREINQVVPSYAGITPERVKEKVGGITWPCPSPEHPGTPILYAEGFRTPDGLGRFIPVEYTPPAEKTSSEYPLVLTTGRVVIHYNSGAMTRRTSSLLSKIPELFVELSPEDAARLEIKEGEQVQISTLRGKTLARAVITGNIKPGVVFIPFHFHGANRLTIDALDPKAKIPEFKVAACKIARIR